MIAAAILARIPLVLEEAAARFGRAKAEAVRLDDRASKALWIITADGEVVSRYGGSVDPMEPTYPVAKELEVSARALIQEVARADADTAAALRELSAQSAGLAPPDQATVAAAATTIPARGSAPADVRKWWDSLTPMQQESLLYTHAAEIGALDGVPAADRDRANRSHLAELKGRLDAEKQRLDAKGDYRTDEETDRLAALNEKLGGIAAIEQRLSVTDPAKAAFLLGIDTQGNGRAIIALGNPDTATNVATYVPGTESRLGNVGGAMKNSEKMLDAANGVGSRQQQPSPGSATTRRRTSFLKLPTGAMRTTPRRISTASRTACAPRTTARRRTMSSLDTATAPPSSDIPPVPKDSTPMPSCSSAAQVSEPG